MLAGLEKNVLLQNGNGYYCNDDYYFISVEIQNSHEILR